MSMTRNGMKMTNPMMNADFSSDRTNAGTRVVSGTSARSLGIGRSAAFVISASSSLRVWSSMNSRNGLMPTSNACCCVRVPFR